MRKYLTSILVTGALLVGVNIGNAQTKTSTDTVDQKPKLEEKYNAGSEYNNAVNNTGSDQLTAKTSESALEEVINAFKNSGECQNVYEAKIKTPNGEQTLVVCDEKVKGKILPKYRINLDDIESVSLHENNGFLYIFEWTIGDDVAVKTKHGAAYTMRLWDKDAKAVYNAIQNYIECTKTNSTEGGI